MRSLATQSLQVLSRGQSLGQILERCEADYQRLNVCEQDPIFWQNKIIELFGLEGERIVLTRGDLQSGREWYELVKGLVNGFSFSVGWLETPSDVPQVLLPYFETEKLAEISDNHPNVRKANVHGLLPIPQTKAFAISVRTGRMRDRSYHIVCHDDSTIAIRNMWLLVLLETRNYMETNGLDRLHRMSVNNQLPWFEIDPLHALPLKAQFEEFEARIPELSASSFDHPNPDHGNYGITFEFFTSHGPDDAAIMFTTNVVFREVTIMERLDARDLPKIVEMDADPELKAKLFRNFGKFRSILSPLFTGFGERLSELRSDLTTSQSIYDLAKAVFRGYAFALTYQRRFDEYYVVPYFSLKKPDSQIAIVEGLVPTPGSMMVFGKIKYENEERLLYGISTGRHSEALYYVLERYMRYILTRSHRVFNDAKPIKFVVNSVALPEESHRSMPGDPGARGLKEFLKQTDSAINRDTVSVVVIPARGDPIMFTLNYIIAKVE